MLHFMDASLMQSLFSVTTLSRITRLFSHTLMFAFLFVVVLSYSEIPAATIARAQLPLAATS